MDFLEPFTREFSRQKEATHPSVVAIKTYFSTPENGRFQKSGTGVFVDRGLIATSASVVGVLSTVRSSEGGATVRKCSLGTAYALTAGNNLLKLKLLAVNFAGDVAVFEAEAADLPPHLTVSTSVPSQEVPIPVPLMVTTRHEGCSGKPVVLVKFGAAEDNMRTEWPYEVEDGLGWARYGGDPVEHVHVVPGSPWFDFSWQVVGLASVAAGGEPAGSTGGFLVPPLRIRSVVEYAKTKDASDPVVLDSWIEAPPSFAGYEPQPQEMESFLNVGEADFCGDSVYQSPSFLK